MKIWSPPSRGVWIETFMADINNQAQTSPPSRGVWIETFPPTYKEVTHHVAPLAGGVD